MRFFRLTATASIVLALTLLGCTASGKLTTEKAQRALDQWVGSGSGTITGIQEVPQDNTAKASITFSNLKNEALLARNYSGPGGATFIHYNDGRWVLSKVYLEGLDTQTTKVTIGSKDEVFYSGAATEQDAKALGQTLQSMGYLKDRGVSVLLSKRSGKFMVSFVVKEGAWDDPAQVSAFEKIARGIAPTIGGLPIQVRLVNSSLDTKKEMTVE